MSAYAIYILGALNIAILGWLIFLTVKQNQLYKKAKSLFDSEKSGNLSQVIEKYLKDVKAVEDHCFELDQESKIIRKMTEKGLHRTGFVRYNPFGDVGGNQSFSLCLLDNNKNGFVISSIHAREGTRVYAKTVTAGTGDYNLSEEEKKAIEIAVK